MYGRIRWGLVLPPCACSAAFVLGRPSPSLLRTRPWRPVPRRAAWTTRGCEHWRARPLCYRPGRVGVQWSTTRERVCIHCEEPPLVRRSVRPRHPPLVVTSAARTRVWTTPRIPRRVVPRANVHGKRHAARELHRGAAADTTAAHACQRSRGGLLALWGVVCARFARGELQPFYAYADCHIRSCERAATLGWDWSRTGFATKTLGYWVVALMSL